MFQSLGDIVTATADAVRPPERLTVAEAAERYRYLNNRGAYVGPWKNSMVPPMVEPMETLTSLEFTGLVFVGPSQASKTEIFLNMLLHTIRCDPSDLMLVECTQNRASDFSKRRVDRLHQHSKLDEFLLPSASADNIFDKRYKSGAMLTLAWPTSTHLSGRPIPRLFFTDYDRMPQDVDGEGSPYDLGQARATTFGRYGMNVAESSPSFPILDPLWVPEAPHQAPPTEGILALYNRGDMRRWYWPCARCDRAFEPTFELLTWEKGLEPLAAGETARLRCPHCGFQHTHDPGKGQPGKHEMNRRGFWLRSGETWRKGVGVEGEPRRSMIASFWLKGEAAAFKSWSTIVQKYLIALNEFHQTGVESALQTTINTDQAQPYTPKAHDTERLPEVLKAKAYDFGTRVVPDPVRFLIAAVDVQRTRFVVQVLGVSAGNDLWVIDRFDVKYSNRVDDDAPEGRDTQYHRIRPFVYREDWWLLLREVLSKSYPLADESGRHMAIRMTVSDSGGQDRATANAYAMWKWLKAGPDENDRDDWPEWAPGMHDRFRIFKGTSSSQVQARTRITFPDSGRQSKFAGARGEIPVLMTNVTPIKNQLDAMLGRDKVGTGRIHFAPWLNVNFYKELCVEVRDEKGVWQNPLRHHNESWDLFVMAMACLIEKKLCDWESIDWDDPPSWAQDWDDNDMVFHPDLDDSPVQGKRKVYDFSRIAEELG